MIACIEEQLCLSVLSGLGGRLSDWWDAF